LNHTILNRPRHPFPPGYPKEVPTKLIKDIALHNDINLPVDHVSGRAKKLDESRVGRNIKALVFLLWEAAFKELRVDMKKMGQSVKATIDGVDTELQDMSNADRATLALGAQAKSQYFFHLNFLRSAHPESAMLSSLAI